MLILNPVFLKQAPPPPVQFALLCTLLWTALPLAGALPVVVTALFGGLWLLRLALLRLHIGRVHGLALVLMLLMVAGLVWQQLGTVFGREGGIAFLLLLVMLKSFESTGRRDWQVLVLAMLFLSGSSVLLNQSLLTGVWLLLTLLLLAVCMALLGGLPFKQAAKRGGQALLLTLPLMVLLFVAVPRSSEPLWRIPQQSAQAKTGLSDTMEPGSISNLVQSNEWVANITFSGQQPEIQDMYWRAIIMADFDGIRWHAVDNRYEDDAEAATVGRTTYQMIVRDQNGVLPALDYPGTSLPRGIGARLGQVLRAEQSREGLRRLTLQASVGDILVQRLNAAEQAFYTRLPREGNPQTRALAQKLRDQSVSPRQFVDQVLHHYRSSSFVYTLQPPKTEGRNGIDEFMFRTRRGFCEHYAQSFVVMMRAGGLPARVVTGYQGGTFNEQAGFWQLRSRDAHAWAEVWLPDEQRWLRVDPTAAVSAVRTQSGVAEALPESERAQVERSGTWANWADTGQYYWQQWVVNYDQNKQNSLFAALGLGGFNFKTLWIVLLPGLLLAFLPVWYWWKNGRRADTDELAEGFMLLKTVLLGSEDEKLAATSATELRHLMAAHDMADDEIDRLLIQYENWLYAGVEPPSGAVRRRWLAQVKKAAKRYVR
ncbi:transglutaminase [Neisseria arctica]|uniref:Transglutaminase n=1 Tax=Neisseria arctica TaxID=1470200 RepID=A0A0J0YPF4_9NEIS|nr:transglutaminase [Neisseria arctica]